MRKRALISYDARMSLRSDIIFPLKEQEWEYHTRFNTRLRRTLMRHDLLKRRRELILVVASEHDSQKVALNLATWAEARAERASKEFDTLRVIIAQNPYHLVIDSHELEYILKAKQPIKSGKPSAYYALAVGIV